MYFACGWPRIFLNHLESDEVIIGIEKSPWNNLLLVFTNYYIYIWSQNQSTVLLNKSKIKAKHPFIQGIWIPGLSNNTDRICILDCMGQCTYFEIKYLQDNKIFNYDFKQKTNSSYYVPLQSIASVSISYLTYTEISSSNITCLCFCNPYIIAGTWEGELLFINSQTNNPFIDYTFHLASDILESEQPFLQSNNTLKSYSLRQVIYVDNLFGFVFIDGRAAVLNINLLNNKKNNDDELDIQILLNIKKLPTNHENKGKWLAQAGATQMAYSPKHQILAVGHNSGEVSLFQAISIDNNENNSLLYNNSNPNLNEEDYTDSFDILRILSLIEWGISPSITGKVKTLKWSPDGSTIAVGWDERGISVWSIYGCRLFCTIPQFDNKHDNKHDNINKRKEVFNKGIKSLCWGEEGYSLWGIPNSIDTITNEYLLQLPFIHSALVNNPSLNYSDNFILKGSDRMYLVDKELDSNSLIQVQFPQTYLSDNWPIRLISVNRDGNEIAVAGKRGIIVYNPIKKCWRLFGDQKQEQKIKCIALSWFKDCIIILNEIDKYTTKTSSNNKKYEILAFPHNHLSYSSILLQLTLPNDIIPLYMDCNDTHIMFFLKDSYFLTYEITCQYNNEHTEKISLHLTNEGKSTNTSINNSLLSFILLPSKKNTPLTTKNKTFTDDYLILNETGRLSISNFTSDFELATSIEQFWYSGLSSESSDSNNYFKKDDYIFNNSLWACGESGIQIWFPFLGLNTTETNFQHYSSQSLENNDNITNNSISEYPMISIDSNNSLEFDVEVYPLTFIPKKGIIIGASQITSYSNASEYPRYDLMIRPQPFLHIILSELLLTSKFDLALHIAGLYSMLLHFEHSLELLLHESLENNNKKDSNTPNLEIVIQFLQCFPIYPEIIVRCARKTDVSHWNLLFSKAGKPKDLFKLCIKHNYHNSAASFLRIIQIIHNPTIAKEAGNMLLGSALDNDLLNIIPDLLRFLESSEDITNNNKDDLLLSSDNDSEAIQEFLLRKYARKLLSQYQLKRYLYFTKITNYSIRYWIIRERNRAGIVDNFIDALNSIHNQFAVPYPSNDINFSSILKMQHSISLVPNNQQDDFQLSPVIPYYPQTKTSPKTNNSPCMKLERTPSDSESKILQSPTKILTSTTGITFILKRSEGITPQFEVSSKHWEQLEELLLVMYNTQCYDWCIILSCVMMNIPLLRHIIHIHKPSWNYLKFNLSLHESEGYQNLLEFLCKIYED